MKIFLIGIISGAMLAGIVYFLVSPGMTKETYNSGYRKGMSEGLLRGKEQGKSEQKIYDDSISAAIKKSEAIPQKIPIAQPKVKRNDYDKNFNVEGNKVGDERK